MNPTSSSTPLAYTDLTDITYPAVSNEQFLSTIFTGLADVNCPFFLGFPGKPKDCKSWEGQPYRLGKSETDNANLNWYFSLATFRPTDDKYYRRQKHCVSVYGVMLDDLGTKALPLNRLDKCPPSYVIETSKGNFQAAYLFESPVDDFDSVKALNQSMVEAGLCDPGATSPTTRYARLPAASNGKTDPAFVCKLIVWHPERRYTVDQIIAGLELAPPRTRSKLALGGKDATKSCYSADGVYVPRMVENEVIVELKKRGLYKSSLGSGKHDVTCPWVHEHTDQIDHGSAYFEPTDHYPIGGYKCQHGHGEKYRMGALLDFLAVGLTAAKHKPTIRVEAGEISRIADAAEQELAATKLYYQRGGLIVSIATDPENQETTIRHLTPPALLRALSKCANWTRYSPHSKTDVVVDPPERHVKVLFDSERYPHLPALSGIARQPYLRSDGSLVREAGFDASTGIYGVFDSSSFNIPENPTRQQAQEALQELTKLLSEFSFSNEHDLSGALAAIMTGTIRPSLSLAPMFHIKAPQIASGKSYLCNIIAIFTGPQSPSAVAFPTSEEECQKLLLATLMGAPGCVIFDNLTTDLIPFKSLCSALSEERQSGRILGVSKIATVGTRTLFLSSGNNVEAIRDMARRCITISIDPQVETPAMRQFSGDPLAMVRANRPKYVSLVLTIVRAWIVDLVGPTPTYKPLASYGSWSKLVREPLLWLGLADPAERVFEQLAQDPDRESLGRLLHAWKAEFGSSPTMIRVAVGKATFEYKQELNEALREVAELRGEINRRSLGRWIARHQGRIVDGLKFEKASGTTSAERWSVKSVQQLMPDKSVMSDKSVSFPASTEILLDEAHLSSQDFEGEL